MFKFLPLFLFITLTFHSFSQDVLYYDDNGKSHEISSSTSKDVVQKYLDQNDFKEIEFNPRENSRFTFRVKTKNGEWIMSDIVQSLFLSQPRYTINFPTVIEESLSVTTVQKGNQKFFFSTSMGYLTDDIWFDEIKTITVVGTLNNYALEENQVINHYLFALKQKNKWALVYLDPFKNEDEPVFRVTPFSYDSFDDLPIAVAKDILLTIQESEVTGLPFMFYQLEELYDYKEIEAIQFNGNASPLVQDKKGDWYLFDYFEVLLIGEKGYSLSFSNHSCGNFTIAERKGSSYFYSMGSEGHGVFENLPFDELKAHYQWVEPDMYDPITGEQYIDSSKYCDFLMLRRKDKWAIAFYDNNSEQPYQISGFHFDNPEEIPDSILESFIESSDGLFYIEYNSEAMSGANQLLLKNEDIDIVMFEGMFDLQGIGYQPLYRIRHSETKRWSYQLLDGFPASTELPIAVSRINAYENTLGNIGVIEVWCDDQVGYYFYDGENIKKIKDCIYDDFQYVFLDYIYGCALKKDGKWELYEMGTDEKMVEGTANTVDALVELWLNKP